MMQIRKSMKTSQLLLLLSALSLAGCSHLPTWSGLKWPFGQKQQNTSSTLSKKDYAKQANQVDLPQRKHYVAPGRAFSVDLTAPVFTSKLSLKQSCTPQAITLTMVDQRAHQYRVEWLNLNYYRALGQPAEQEAAFYDNLTRFYQTRIYPNSELIAPAQSINSPFGASRYATLKRSSGDQVGILMTYRGQTALILQYPQAQGQTETMRATLRQLAQAVQFPASAVGQSAADQVDMLLPGADATQRANWQRRTGC